jgi:UDP-glucuronate decarboxylase
MHPNDGRVVSGFIMQALLNQDITVFGDGDQTRSFCYVDDMVAGLVKMMSTSPEVTGPINLGNPNEMTVRDLAEVILDLTGSRAKIVHQPLPTDDPRMRRPDISEADRVLDWRPTTSLNEGLVDTIRYFEHLLAKGRIPSSDSAIKGTTGQKAELESKGSPK